MAEFSYKNFSEVDFETIKESLKNHLKSQDIFKDYDFDGSAINVLINLLAYNTQYNSYYLNMMASEKFILNAQRRESVVGLANNNGYVPKSATSAETYVSFDVIPSSGFTDNLVIPKDVVFSTDVDGVSYQFRTVGASVYSLDPQKNIYSIKDLQLKEGKKFTHRYVVDLTSKFYKIPNKNVDISRVTISVKTAKNVSDSTAKVFEYYNNILDLTSESEVYYIQEAENKTYEVYFGDGVLGKKLQTGNEIIIEYYSTNGSAPNGATEFSLVDEFTGLGQVINLTAQKVFNGSDIESTESIRIASTVSRRVQNRAIISKDYEFLLKSRFPTISDISVWGGEYETPKQYGKVFISAIKNNSENLSVVEKRSILQDLTENSLIIGITPEIKDVDVCNVIITSVVTTPPATNTNLLKFEITKNIQDNVRPNLSKFNASIYQSRIEQLINSTDSSIISNRTSFTIYYNLVSKIINATQKSIKFPVKLEKDIFQSNNFNFNNTTAYLKQTSPNLISIVSSQNEVLLLNALSIDYDTGILSELFDGLLYELAKEKCVIYVTPKFNDIKVTANNILRLVDSDIRITFENE